MSDINSDDFCFDIVKVAPRERRPRKRGLTITADRGLGSHAVADLLQVAEPFIDIIKVAMGVASLLPRQLVRAKLATYQAHNIPVFFAGEISELAIMQGSVREFYRDAKSLGGWGIEISNAQITLSISDKVELINIARSEGIEVVAECGHKGGEDWAKSYRYVAAEVGACFDAGARFVLVQAEGVNEGVVKIREDLLLSLAADFGLERLIFQAKDQKLVDWFVGTLGNRVNLDVDSPQILELEAARRGIRKKGIFASIGSL